MNKADEWNDNEGGEGMTDRQFVHHLRDLLLIAKSSANLEEFIKKLEKMISSFERR